MTKTIYDFDNYRNYLLYLFGAADKRTGSKSLAAKAMGCSSAYLSRVLKGVANLSLEQVQRLTVYLRHTFEETQYFILLLNYERAGTTALRDHFKKELELIHRKQSEVTRLIPTQEVMPASTAAIYYSQWYYSAIHVLLSIPTLQSADKIAQYLGIQTQVVVSVMQFLEQNNLVQSKGPRYELNMQLTHLASDSPFIAAHHLHWRNKTCAHLGMTSYGMHYSGVVAMLARDAVQLKQNIAMQLRENLNFIAGSKEEEGYAYCIDFFPLNDAPKKTW